MQERKIQTYRLRKNSEYNILAKIIIIGDVGVGKSCIMLRYADNVFNEEHITTIGVDFKVVTLKKESKVIKVQLWDSAGAEKFRTITQAYYRGSHGIFIVYDVSNRDSFENVPNWFDDVKRIFGESSPVVILVGNKTDKKDDRVVSFREGIDLAHKYEFDAYLETSAKENCGIDNAFDLIVDKIMERLFAFTPETNEKDTIPLVKRKKKFSCCS